ncbi:uncharacterized protein Z518_09119 [Rhinocladiella mackenziei CBS 650.93]|uniref:Uncharacterized protein n=1 Tax=Rhinocladiella mackenziei CBS 650.93 TaxID=1442369 RepID=A0A0D2GSP6_9EURO|nr:uncharacterized protein Z518_09119 [Rhinocladiella mackenziei CBS 650.93]KIX01393.1 hypothetical protein Z518_09119 [Rhinocladiella mackenziei CBS 650.93]
MFLHALRLHKREPQRQDGTDNLPSSIPNPTATLPQSIVPTDVTADPSATAQIATAQQLSGLTTITDTQTLVESITSLNIMSTVTSERVKTITDPAEYSSLTAAAALSSSTTAQSTSSKISAAATSSAAAQKSSSNLSTLIPAIVVPIAVVLLASLGLFWFFMRRRHKRELERQPEFVMAGKGEKLSSRSNSSRSATSDTWTAERKSPAVNQTELTSTKSPPTTTSEWPSPQIGVARPLTPQESESAGQHRPFDPPRLGTANSEPKPYRNFSGPGAGPGPRPATSGRPGPPSSRDQGQHRNRNNSTPGQRGPPSSRSGPSPTPRTTPSPVLRNGPSPGPPRLGPIKSPQGLPGNPRPNATTPSAAFRLRDPSPSMNHNVRAQAPSRLEAPPPGAYNGASSISQYSPIVKETPNIPKGPGAKRNPLPPLNTSNMSESRPKPPNSASPRGNILTEENLRIARLANSSRLGYTPGEPSPSPKLPPPATRSQLIPLESPKDQQDHFFSGSGNGNSLPQSRAASSRDDYHGNAERVSIVSEPDEYEDIAAKSDVSSLNEFERFDFSTDAGSRGGSAAGGSLNYFASQNNPASERGSPFGSVGTHERW